MNEKFYTTEEIAEVLKVSDRTVRNLCVNGDMEFNRIGAQIRVSETQFQNYLNKTLQVEKENEQ